MVRARINHSPNFGPCGGVVSPGRTDRPSTSDNHRTCIILQAEKAAAASDRRSPAIGFYLLKTVYHSVFEAAKIVLHFLLRTTACAIGNWNCKKL
jgi:hypothetical protein